MKTVRIGIIGYGNMGKGHADYLFKNEIENAKLTAICDRDPQKLKLAKEKFGDAVELFDDAEKLFAAHCCDGVMVETPHYYHPPLAMRAFETGYHALVEKPAGVYTKNVRKMNEAAKKSGKVFGIMFNERTRPEFIALKKLLESGETGEIKRTNWIITDWYRPQAYYDSGLWRATYCGEGGGVLMNQAPHNLDLWQWTCGMPVSVHAFCRFGQYHNIEVEDDVTAYVKYQNGATGVFITSTGEMQGTNRLEIMADRGKIVVEGGRLKFWKMPVSERRFNAENKKDWPELPPCEVIDVPLEGTYPAHRAITRNWVSAILNGTPLIADGTEGINGLLLCNAMVLSTWLDQWVDIPFDEDLYLEELKKHVASSMGRENNFR